MLSPVVQQDTYEAGQSIDDLGETDKFQEWVQLWERPKTEPQKAKRLSHLALKGLVNVTQSKCSLTSMLLGPHLKMQQPNTMLVNLWKVSKLE